MYKTPLAYRPEIDGLRALAVMAVLMFHLGFSFIPGGFVGVDIFFVISGFLITRIVHKQVLDGSFSYIEFYARRIRRIFPALFTMLGVSTILAILFLVPGEYKSYVKELSGSILQIANIHFAGAVDYFDKEKAESALLHTWSLGVEEQFYLFWPIFLIALHKFSNDVVRPYILYGFIAISLCISQYLVVENPNHAFYMIYSRAWELAFGGVIALNLIKRTDNTKVLNALGLTGIALIIYAIFMQTERNFPGIMAIVPVLGTGIIIYTSLYYKTYVGRVLSWKPLVWLGLISYSLYLWHWPLIAFYKSYFSADLTLPAQLSIMVASTILAWLSYKFVETPFRTQNSCKKRVVLIGLLMMAVLAPLSNVLKTGYRYDWRYTNDFDADILKTHSGIIGECRELSAKHKNGWCVKNANADDTFDVLLMGDSHGIHYAPSVISWAERKGLTVRVLVTSSCPVWLLAESPKLTVSGTCKRTQVEARKALTHPNLKYAFMALRYDRFLEEDPREDIYQQWKNESVSSIADARVLFSSLFNASLDEIAQLIPIDAKTVLLGQVPMSQSSYAHCVMKKSLLGSYIITPSTCESDANTYSDNRLKRSRDIVKLSASNAEIFVFEPEKYMNTIIDAEGRPIYRDTHHLNQYGAEMLIPLVGRFMNNLQFN